MNNFLKVEVSAETPQQADEILNALLTQKIVTGGQIIAAPARFLWKEEVVDMEYYTITSFTTPGHKQAIIELVTKISAEEVPMISFLQIDANPQLEHWISETVGSKI